MIIAIAYCLGLLLLPIAIACAVVFCCARVRACARVCSCACLVGVSPFLLVCLAAVLGCWLVCGSGVACVVAWLGVFGGGWLALLCPFSGLVHILWPCL